MIYRDFEENDTQQIKDLCGKHKIGEPKLAHIIVAEEGKRIVGFIALKNVVFIEPMISENPIASKKLFVLAERVLEENKIRTVRCFCKINKKKLYSKVGFQQVFEDQIIMEKNYKD